MDYRPKCKIRNHKTSQKKTVENLVTDLGFGGDVFGATPEVGQFLVELHLFLPRGPVIGIPGTYPDETKTRPQQHLRMVWPEIYS